MQTAPDQATVQKLQAKLQGDQTQLAQLQGQVDQANQQVLVQKAENDSQQQKSDTAQNTANNQDLIQGITNLKQTGTVVHSDKFLNQ